MGSGVGYPPEWEAVSLETKLEAGFRCVRCQHPNGIWCPTGTNAILVAETFAMRHAPPLMLTGVRTYPVDGGVWIRDHRVPCDSLCTHDPDMSSDRILTVHHLDGVKANLAWWNLAALCQRCHLTIQGRVKMPQTYQLEHSTWFLPYVAGFYAATILGEDLTRTEVDRDLVRLLAAGQPHLEDAYRARLSHN